MTKTDVSFKSLGWDRLDWYDQADIMHRLNREFEELPRPAISPEFKAELIRRRDHAIAHPEEGVPWDELYAELLSETSE